MDSLYHDYKSQRIGITPLDRIAMNADGEPGTEMVVSVNGTIIFTFVPITPGAVFSFGLQRAKDYIDDKS